MDTAIARINRYAEHIARSPQYAGLTFKEQIAYEVRLNELEYTLQKIRELAAQYGRWAVRHNLPAIYLIKPELRGKWNRITRRSVRGWLVGEVSMPNPMAGTWFSDEAGMDAKITLQIIAGPNGEILTQPVSVLDSVEDLAAFYIPAHQILTDLESAIAKQVAATGVPFRSH